jgi:photosystem II stability/assembly factor-like uncharacterized protein
MKKKYPKFLSNIKLGYLVNYLKILIVLILIFLINFTFLLAQWEPCNNGISGSPINYFIIDGKNTYTGIGGGVFMTTNNGDNWDAKNNGLESSWGLDVESLAISGNNIFAGTFFDGIFLSTDKGENWVQKSNGFPFNVINKFDTVYSVIIYAIIINGNNIFVGTDKGGIYLSTDNGENWTSKNNGLPQLDSMWKNISSIVIIDNNIFAGTKNGVFISNDNGNNWFPKNKNMENMDVFSLAINGYSIYAGTRYGIFISTNNGEDWKNIGLKDTLIASIIIKENYIFAAGHGVDISTNNGYSWIAKNSGLTCFGTLSLIINGDYIFAGDASCGIFRAKLSDLGITDVKETEQKNESIIYPNPASSEVKLKFESTNISKIQISIYDLLGKEVFSSSEDCNIGLNEKVIDCRSLGTGYYIIRLKQNDKVEAKPLLILK